MRSQNFSWTLSHARERNLPGKDKIPATVPGAIGLDYAKAFDYPPYYYEKNYEKFHWMEDEFFFYETELEFTLEKNEYAFLYLDGVDYEYDVTVGGEKIYYSEGMFAPSRLDVSRYAGKKLPLTVTVYPIPKSKTARRPGTRDEAQESCKPPSAYTWDWHPRLVSTGIWKDVRLEIHGAAVIGLDASYRLSDALDEASVSVELETVGCGEATVTLSSPDGVTVYEDKVCFSGDTVKKDFTLASPLLWYPRGYGEHPVYTLTVKNGEKALSRKIGFKRVKLLRNFDDTNPAENAFPKTRYSAPATFEINGVRVFAKGSNWVNTEIFPCLMTYDRYAELLTLVEGANMNILRMWGGQFINHDCFYDLCDERGIMIWQEFVMSCNRYPDTDKFLSVLEREATHIIKNLRTHPAIVLWCGGNELFNSWSGMTDQSHPLRLLNHLCYTLDRFVPFNYTSPLTGMAHGTYNTLTIRSAATKDEMGLGGGIAVDRTEEFITLLSRSYFTAYTEFGSSGCADPEYIKKYIMSEENYLDFGAHNEIWVAHHAFKAWGTESWARPSEIDYYFGGYESVDDYMHKSLAVQAISYQSLFEEMRKQWPHCSMAINWDFNEPWPCAAGNSLVNWPTVLKPAYFAVQAALRPTIASIRTRKNRYLIGEEMNAEVWVLNDSADEFNPTRVKVYLENKGEKKLIAESTLPACEPRANKRAELGFTLPVTEEMDTFFTVSLEVEGKPEMNSTYKFIAKKA